MLLIGRATGADFYAMLCCLDDAMKHLNRAEVSESLGREGKDVRFSNRDMNRCL